MAEGMGEFIRPLQDGTQQILPPIPLEELRKKVVTVKDTIGNQILAEEEALFPTARVLKEFALAYLEGKDQSDWLNYRLRRLRHLDGIISELRHVEGGQEHILGKLQELRPDLTWYRGGTIKKWSDEIGSVNSRYFTDEQLDTYVLDGGGNGSLGRPSTALGFFHLSPRENPVFYTLTLSDLLHGKRSKAINLVSEHDYDLMVKEGDDRQAYLEFCRNNLKIQRVVKESI